MLLLKIATKSFFSFNTVSQQYIKYLAHKIKILQFYKNKTFSFYLCWLILFTIIELSDIKLKIDYYISYILYVFFNKQKLISYIITVNSSTTNTLVSVKNIKGNPKFFYSAGMFNLKKKQKIKQPKATITILRTLLLKSKFFKTEPAALHFNKLFATHQSYIFKRLKHKIFIKLVMSYNYQPHNGCRLRKKKRIKIRTKTKKL